ncbi:hypothetical protein ASPZODRAFT_139646 [Penicilliopsis zonata CBS 506.65]|uniref:Uncharacterized protein n=1 Tax=Penicilliopsis zonata CBS 506.65 TaxID=1073090 RepID=A0A1L9STA4_9EURO|nr:hypothetical protein ASPZODRAFT_139646 [Penicilliopsis zonata CBS 506.65]OJJ50344.1 hypothetical protein ASPZODRAFT_139646 [Penicilliopsis zonata CBS 506.65]
MTTERFPGFTSLNNRTWLFTPDNPTPGELVIVCSWTGARPQHIIKYLTLHRTTVAVGARILLVETAAAMLVSSYAHQRATIRPAAQVVRETLAEGDSPRIMLHLLSNGGCLSAVQMLLELRGNSTNRLPLVGMMLDSAPDDKTYWQTHKGIVTGRRPSSRLAASVLAHVVLLPIWTGFALGKENPQSAMCKILLDGSLIAGVPSKNEAGVSVCYIYSKTDTQIIWKEVHDHALEARNKGWEVEEIVYDDTGHCAHLSADEKRYTDALKWLWSQPTQRSSKL